MKNAQDLLVELYAIKLTNYRMIMDATTIARTCVKHFENMHEEYEKIEIGKSVPEYAHNYKLRKQRAQLFISPVISKLCNPDNNDSQLDKIQTVLLQLLQSAQEKKIIELSEDKQVIVKEPVLFKTEVLQKCKLPCFLSQRKGNKSIYYIDTIANVEFFHSLTGADMPHLIHEQMEQVFNEEFFKNKPFEKGIVRDTDAMYGAVKQLGYHYFTTKNETNAAINTDGMQLARQIRDRMFERVKKS